jgi:FkbM family methyltransferase
MSVKEAVIQGMRTVSPLTAPFFDTLLAWSQKYRELRFLLPAGKQFVYDQYLGKFQVNIDTTFPIEAEMATGRYDLKTSAVLQKFITVDATVLDIGANVGALTLLMASLTPQGRVVAIEPGPSTFARLQANVELNSQLSKRVDIYQLGIADQPGVLYWQEDANVPGNAGLLSQDGVEVKVEALDDFIPQLALDRLDFIKIDVEGMEYEVIKGGLDTIAQYRPILYYETLESFRVNRGFDMYNQIFQLLQDLGYRQFAIAPQARTIEVANLDTLLSPNTLAIPAEQVPTKESAEKSGSGDAV